MTYDTDEEKATVGVAYGLIAEEYTLQNHTRKAYGVAAYAHPKLTGSTVVITAVRDITSDRQAVAALVALCNRMLLSPVHLADVIDDFFGT